jgi:hypothetical protein
MLNVLNIAADEGDLMALRYGDWKAHFMEQRGEGVLAWQEPFVPLRLPKLFNLRSDPFENGDVASQMFYAKRRGDRRLRVWDQLGPVDSVSRSAEIG